jgi:hypothetical protein
MRFLLTVLLTLWGVSAHGEDIGLVRIGQNWKYFKGTNEPRGDLGQWRNLDYNDSTWPVAISSLSTPQGFAETTVVYDYGLAYTTIYFRKRFHVDDPSTIAQLIFRIDYDDGFVAYLNGKEIARRGFPGAANELVPFNQLAAYHLRGFTEEIDVSPGIPLGQKGENILAIQLLGSSATADYTACMAAELVANFTRSPYVQNATTNSIQIIYKTPSLAATSVQYGLTQDSAAETIVDQSGTNHVATLTNLAPGTTYTYRVGAVVNGKQVYTVWSIFRTFVPSGPINFFVMGDTGWATVGQMQIAQHLPQEPPPDLLMHVGDLIYYNFSQYSADLRCFSLYNDFMRKTPVYLALGNHDSYITKAEVLSAFYLPSNPVTSTEHYYSFDHGDVHFVALWADLQSGVPYGVGSPEYNWLEQDLATTTRPWKFLFFHHVFRSSALHGTDDYNFNKIADRYEIQGSIGALASKYGVQLIFNGHDHDYERFTPLNGPFSIITGGGGAALYPVWIYEPTSVTWFSRYHYLRVGVNQDEATLQAVDAFGTVWDTFHIRRDFPARKTYQAAWKSPIIESTPANDGDGNITGQKFDFTGEPISSKPGKFSSVGRVFVNNDLQNIYIGIDEMSIDPTNIVYLFLENPKQPGVATMAGLGNGILDPEGEGADGLDFIENLSFTNFAPSMGVILGDEKADGLFRSYARPSGTNFGQGAFYLRPGFPEVPGQRLQQYNHSPQDIPFLYEQNANFVELALPYAALGVHQGETIRVALIAALGAIDTNTQTQPLDSGGVCYSLATQDTTTWLEGVEVQLATGPLELQATRKNDNTLELSWSTLPGKKYQLQATTDLSLPFHDVTEGGFPRTAVDYQDSISITGLGSKEAEFFRMMLVP